MSQRILVINPNSTQAVTDNMSRALEPLRMEGGLAIECMTLAEGPPGVESQADVESVVLPVSRVVRDREEDGAAVAVMGCAGMERFKARVQEAIGIPVVEPTQAAVTMAIGAVRLTGQA